MKNWEENVFQGIAVGAEEGALVCTFLKGHDFALGTRKGIVLDLRKLARWFAQANKEPFVVKRVTTRDVTDYGGPHCLDQKIAFLRYTSGGRSPLPLRYR